MAGCGKNYIAVVTKLGKLTSSVSQEKMSAKKILQGSLFLGWKTKHVTHAILISAGGHWKLNEDCMEGRNEDCSFSFQNFSKTFSKLLAVTHFLTDHVQKLSSRSALSVPCSMYLMTPHVSPSASSSSSFWSLFKYKSYEIEKQTCLWCLPSATGSQLAGGRIGHCGRASTF